MATINSGARCCPDCGCDQLNKETAMPNRAKQDGARYKCLDEGCSWTGFALQLVKKSGADGGTLSKHPALKWQK